TYSVAANTGAPNAANAARSGTITIAGHTFTLIETGCTFSIAPTSETFGSAAGSGAVAMTTPAACSWTGANLPSWASAGPAGNGTGPGTWQYSVAANAGGERSQTITIGTGTFTLRQLAVGVKTIVPGSRARCTLADAVGAFWAIFESVAGRSYCAFVA